MTDSLRCSGCTSTDYLPIPMDGPVDARVILIAERPGQDEEREYRRGVAVGEVGPRLALIGQAGRELNDNYLYRAGLRRDEVRAGNVVLCGAKGNRHPNVGEMASCPRSHLPYELERTDPEVVILLGGVASSLIPDIDLEVEHGIPRRGELFGWSGWVVPMYHPAAGLHKTDMMIPMLEDWDGLQPWLESGMRTWQWPADRFDGQRDYRLVGSTMELDDYIGRWVSALPDPTWDVNTITALCGADSETHDGDPYSYQLSLSPGTGIMILLDNVTVRERLRDRLRELVRDYGLTLIFHNAMADLDITEHVIGLERGSYPYRDTQQEAYQFQNLPQGLKALAYRRLGRRRSSWEETVGGASRAALATWLASGWSIAESEWKIVEERVSEKTGRALKPKISRHPVESTFWRLLSHVESPTYDPWAKLVEGLTVDDLERVVESIGPWPRKGIRNVDLERQVQYAVSDADDTLRLALLFDDMRREAGAFGVSEGDWDDRAL